MKGGRFYFSKYANEINLFYKMVTFFPFFFFVLTYFFSKNNSKFSLLIRYFDVKRKAKKTGENIYIASNVVLKNLGEIEFGDNVSIHEYSYVDGCGGISIGNNVSIAHNCSLVSFEHSWEDMDQAIKYNPTILKPIKIGNDVWLGCGVRVLSGAIIEDRVVVAAGAVVKGRLESGYLYGGIPVKKLKKL